MFERLKNKTIVNDQNCWVWQGSKTSFGYGRTTVGSRKDGTRKSQSTHRAMYECVNGIIENGLWVLHKCDNPSCINPEHLFLGTRQDNVDDRENKNRNNHTRKLSDDDVVFIHSNKNIIKGRDLAKMFNVGYDTIKGVWCGKVYKNPKPTPPDNKEG